MATSQPGILAPIAAAGRYVTLALAPGAAPREVLDRLRRLRLDDALVAGIGEPFARALGKVLPGLRTFPALSGPAGAIPSTQAALLLHARSDDHGGTLRAMRRALAGLGDGVRIEEDVAAFKHGTGRDLSGYEDGTENPKDDAAVAAAVVSGEGAGRDGASFVAVQRWVHDLARLERFAPRARDELIGRSLETNEELADAPAHAHIRRSQQEGFDPPAFMVRRSMPYGTVREHGLYFVAYVASLGAFERMLTRMAGLEDGLADGLFQFSRPVSGGYYWCPPVAGAHLDLSALD
jgi:putative iron-dependent peroxidase